MKSLWVIETSSIKLGPSPKAEASMNREVVEKFAGRTIGMTRRDLPRRVGLKMDPGYAEHGEDHGVPPGRVAAQGSQREGDGRAGADAGSGLSEGEVWLQAGPRFSKK